MDVVHVVVYLFLMLVLWLFLILNILHSVRKLLPMKGHLKSFSSFCNYCGFALCVGVLNTLHKG